MFEPAAARPLHGGRLRQAAARYGIPLAGWIDLSTGINPQGWPVPSVPPPVWQRLPEEEDGLREAAADYYATPHLLPLAGSQAAIQALPHLRPPCRATLVAPGYAEHAYAWRAAGHRVREVPAEGIEGALPEMDVLVLIHPNNPTGARFERDRLLAWQGRLAERGGWLLLDEAFLDAAPESSLAPFCPRPGLIVLRSLGKFFGLAGARVGFACAEPGLLDRLDRMLGPWTLAGPARWAASGALQDRAWQAEARRQLTGDSERLAGLLTGHGLAPGGGCALFQWIETPRAADLHEALARRGILTRLFTDPPGLRLGLPASEGDWERLDIALKEVIA